MLCVALPCSLTLKREWGVARVDPTAVLDPDHEPPTPARRDDARVCALRDRNGVMAADAAIGVEGDDWHIDLLVEPIESFLAMELSELTRRRPVVLLLLLPLDFLASSLRPPSRFDGLFVSGTDTILLLPAT